MTRSPSFSKYLPQANVDTFEFVKILKFDQTPLPQILKYVLNLKLTKYSQWKLSGRLLCDLEPLELTVNTITIHDKGDTSRGGEMYLPTTKVRTSLRMKGVSE